MKLTTLLSALALTSTLSVAAEQYTVQRIEKMPTLPQPYVMRDWKAVTRDYVRLVLNPVATGDYMPLGSQSAAGTNYPDYHPLYLDSYVGGENHGSVAEAVNIMPAVVSAYLTGNRDESSYNLEEACIDFFNARNGQNVYLNSFSEKSGNDWWYDLMPNVYYYQLYRLASLPDKTLADSQYRSIADQWLAAVYALGGKTYNWTVPTMSYRAFNLETMKPLTTGVREPESAGTIAWLLFHAYLSTGSDDYRKGAELAMEYLSSLGSNPAYELQLAYGVQAAAKMNAMLGTSYNVTKLFGNCFDRGYLRGWGSIVGTWGGYDVSGLIGEANDGGDDYAFIMNGFQQAAALAPAVKYDKRLARAYGRWMLNVANASRLFYVGYIPQDKAESASYAWSVANDPNHVIPYESMKEKWNGVTPYAMGDAVRGGWAATNLSLYSGSSVGYMAAVVDVTDVEAILRLDLNATDLDGRDKLPTYLYYNPYTTDRTVTMSLPSGSYRIYDAITETMLTESASSTYALSIPADGVRLVTLIPTSVTVTNSSRTLSAGDIVVDYHVGYAFDRLLRIKNLEAEDAYPVVGSSLVCRATVEGLGSSTSYSWAIDGATLSGYTSTTLDYPLGSLAAGSHQLTFTMTSDGTTVSHTIPFTVLTTAISVPEIEELTLSVNSPARGGQTVVVECRLKDASQPTDIAWTALDGSLEYQTGATTARWTLPAAEGVYDITCTASNVKGSAKSTASLLVRSESKTHSSPVAYFKFDGDLNDELSAVAMAVGSGSASYSVGFDGTSGSALNIPANYYYLSTGDALSASDAISLTFWTRPSSLESHEQFILSHGSWQDRYKVSITPEKRLRWTAKTSRNVVDTEWSTEMSVGRYDFVAAIYTGYSIELYVNGQLVDYSALTGTLGSTVHPLTLGSMTESDMAYNYNGLIDELRIFDRALSPADVTALYRDNALGVADVEVSQQPGLKVVDRRVVATNPDFTVTDIYAADATQRSVNQTLSPGLYIVRVVGPSSVITTKLCVD